LDLRYSQNLIFRDKNNNPGDLINVFTSAIVEYTKLMNNLLFSKNQFSIDSNSTYTIKVYNCILLKSVIKIFVQRTFKLAIVFERFLYAVNNFIKAAYFEHRNFDIV
jgi:hypothetical protein